MSPAAAFHAQLASIMEVLANTAVAEICELVDSGYSVLQLEISRSRKENEVLRRKLRLLELRAARGPALRAAVTASGAALLHATGRARAQLHGGHEARRTVTPAGEAAPSRVSSQETARHRDSDPASDSGQETTQGMVSGGGRGGGGGSAAVSQFPAGSSSSLLETTPVVIKVEDDDESWSDTDKGSCRVAEGQMMEAEAPSPLVKQEAADDDGGGGGVSSRSWTSGELSSTSTSCQKTLNTSQRPETSRYDCLMFEPQLQHGSHASQNPLGVDPGCSSALNPSVSVSADSGGSSFPFTLGEASLSAAECQQPAGFHNSQQRAPLPPPEDEQQLPVRKEMAGRASMGRDGWRLSRASGHSREDSGEKAFVCNCCGKTLACLKNLKTHMRVHTGEKPFVCALCGKRFSDSSNLKRHQSVHTGEKRYGCVHCGKRFAQSGSLKVHMTVHTDCKQFRCSYCGKTFISGSHLRRHIAVHAAEKRAAATLQ